MKCDNCNKEIYRNAHLIYETKETLCHKCYLNDSENLGESFLQDIEEGLTGAEWLDKTTALQLVSEVRRLRAQLDEVNYRLKELEY
jgi:hypothetical protein